MFKSRLFANDPIAVIETKTEKCKRRRDVNNVTHYYGLVENRAAGWWLLRPRQRVLLCLGVNRTRFGVTR